MVELRVIDGIQKEKVDYFTIYIRMYRKSLIDINRSQENYGIIERDLQKKLVFSGVRMFNELDFKEISYQGLKETFQLLSFIHLAIGELTPREFMTIFPIDKEYDGSRYGTKDYFSTMKALNKMDMDKPIGDNLHEFLWSYWNWKDVARFECNAMSLVSEISKAEGGQGLAEHLSESMGISSYTLSTDYKGRQIAINNSTGETIRVKKKHPRYLRLVK